MQGLSTSRVFCETTFRPDLDRWMALDGAAVVLSAGSAELVLLRFEGDAWCVRRHSRMNGVASASGASPAVCYRGLSYDSSGVLIARLEGGDDAHQWHALYDTATGNDARPA